MTNPAFDDRTAALQEKVQTLEARLFEVKSRLDAVVFWLLAIGGAGYVLFWIWMAKHPPPR
jgi:hypothetical protein